MCGIVGYVGFRRARPILISGLKRLEYRGYDSAGMAVLSNGQLSVVKTVGKVKRLVKLLGRSGPPSTIGIAHTRWATHGEPSTVNAHPHVDCHEKIALVHNGIIENYQTLRHFLKRRGVTCKTDTDTEVLVHLISLNYRGDLPEAVRRALLQVKGTYGLAVISALHPGLIVAARNGSPLVIGYGQGEHYVASDVSAILAHTKNVSYLADGEVAALTAEHVAVKTVHNKKIAPQIRQVTMTLDQIEKSGYAHFMAKEIHEQPTTLQNACRGRLDLRHGTTRLDGLNLSTSQIKKIRRVVISACGTSWHSALIGEYLIESLAGLPVEVEYASEYRYRSPIMEKDTLFVSISQSGETADTIGAQREAKRRGARIIGIVNVVGSTIARENDGGIYIHAGPEIGVASTKAFTSQVIVLAMLAILLGRTRGFLSCSRGRQLLKAIQMIPGQVEQILKLEPAIKKIARSYYRKNHFLFLGRGVNFPTALEGALKLKEISYIHAEGYPAAEMKHGPIALIDKKMPVVVMAMHDSVYEKVMSNIEEVRSRRGAIIAVANKGDKLIAKKAKHVIYLPNNTGEMFTPILAVIPLQLLAYHIARLRRCHIDQPRNLAKSVTVE
jgi:glucosamine--fructose-6-phosphate aminotransferase (isomerizing)